MSRRGSGHGFHLRKSLWVAGGCGLAFLVVLAACTSAPAPTPTSAPKPTAVPAPIKQAEPAPAAKTDVLPKAPGATATPAAAAAAKTASVKVGVLGLSADAGVYIALEKGYFKDEGIEVSLTEFRSAGEMVPPLATGQLDVGGGSAAAGLFNAINREIPVKVVADRGYVPSSRPSSAALAARKDLVDAGGLKDFADLKGKTLATNVKGSASEYALARALELGNLAWSDVKLVEMGFPDMLAAFGNKSIDVGYEVEPFLTAGRTRGLLVTWKSLHLIVPDHQVAMWLYSPEFIKNQPDAARRFMVALLRGARDYNDAFFKNKGKDQVVSFLMKYTQIKDAAQWDVMAPTLLNPDGYVIEKDLINQQEWYFKQGYVKEKLESKVFIDNQYVDYAVQRLGKYQ